jgi:hypothetical protein
MPRTRSKQAWRLQLPTKLHYFKFAHHDNTINHRQQPTVTTTKITHAAQHNTTQRMDLYSPDGMLEMGLERDAFW